METNPKTEYLKKHLCATWGFLTDVFAARAEGVYVYDGKGRAYMDFTSGHAVCNIGHCHPAVVAAIKEQTELLIHSGSTFYYDSIYELTHRLADITPAGLDRFFYANSGAEAVEGAIKLARWHTGRQGIISFTGSFHGRTLGTITLGASNSKYRSRYHPLLPSVYHAFYPYCFRCPVNASPEGCEYGCLEHVNYIFEHEIAARDVAAVIIEPVLGEGGYHPAPAGYLERLRDLCTDNGILLIFDEVQSGIGRTARWFAMEHYGVRPDIVTLAKGIASGLPLSAIISTAEIMDGWEKGAHGTTFGGNPIACAAAAATLDAIEDEGLLKKAERISEGVFTRLSALKEESASIGDVRGLGYMIGVEFVGKEGAEDPGAAAEARRLCLEDGLLLLNAGTRGNVIRFIPPLNTSEDQMDEALGIFERAVRRL